MEQYGERFEVRLSKAMRSRIIAVSELSGVKPATWARGAIEKCLQPLDSVVLRANITTEVVVNYANWIENDTRRLLELKKLLEERSRVSRELLNTEGRDYLCAGIKEINLEICRLLGV